MILRFIFQLAFYYIFWGLLQPSPLPSHSMLLGENEVKSVCSTESGPVYAQHLIFGGRGSGRRKVASVKDNQT